MSTRRLVPTDQRGVALPMAMMALLVLAALVTAFSVLSASEPTIANNQLRTAQARAMAEAGVERAIWALSNPTVTGGLADPLPSPVPAPYDGSQLVMLSVGAAQLGGFRVTVTPAVLGTERNVAAVGWVPSESSTQTRAHQRITAQLAKLRFIEPPCALCVRGDLDISGTSDIDARGDTSCGAKKGTFSTGSTTIQGNGSVYGADGNDTRNQATDMLVNQPVADFDAFAWTSADLDILKSIAKSRGTYYQGAVTFDAGNKLPDGLIFVDTTTGNNITDSTPDSEFASVSIHGNAGTGANNSFRGWIVVNGSLTMSGNIQIDGLIYAVNDLYYSGTGTGRVTGAVMSQNVRDTSVTTVDTTAIGNSLINYNCSAVRTGGGQIPQGWFVKAGSYREVSD
jgi:hypothetical protein